MTRHEIGSECVIVYGDALEVRPELPTDAAIVTDPPYGIAFNFAKKRRGRKSGLSWGGNGNPDIQRDWSRVTGDEQPFNPSPWLTFPFVVLWGANHYADRLPTATRWLVWDKRDGTTSDDHSDCEMAWTNLKGAARLYSHLWRGICRAGEENVAKAAKLHPAQKPLALMRWCLSFLPEGVLVVDPYMGSGTTGVACLQTGHPFIGVETDSDHFEVARERLLSALDAGLFAPTVASVTPDLFEGTA